MRFRLLLLSLLTLALLALSGACRTAPQPTPTPPPTATPTAQPSPTPPHASGLTLFSDDQTAPPVPRLIDRQPAGGQELSPDGALELVFNVPMDRDATAAALQLLDDQGEPVGGEISWADARTLRFKPDRALKPGAGYRAVLGDQARSQTGVPLPTGLTIPFATRGPLRVGGTAPRDGAEEIASDATITVIFNRPVVPLALAEETAALPTPLVIEPTAPGEGTWINTSVYTWKPSAALIGRQTYTVRVAAETINQIAAEAQMEGDYTFRFSVAAPTIAYVGLRDGGWLPTDYGFLELRPAFAVEFAQPMDRASVETAVALAPAEGGAPVAQQFRWNDLSTTVIFTPTQLLAPATVYRLTLADTAQAATGGRLAEGIDAAMTTVPLPAIVRTEPADGETEQPFSGRFVITFASPMDEQTLFDKLTFSPPLQEPGFYYDRWGASQLYVYGLRPSTTYTVQIAPGMAAPYGNQIAAGQRLTFTTAPAPPFVGFRQTIPLYSTAPALYRVGGAEDLLVAYRNVRGLEVGLYRLTLDSLIGFQHRGPYPSDYQPPEGSLVRRVQPTPTAASNATGLLRLPLRDADGRALPPGLYFATAESPQVSTEYARYDSVLPILIADLHLTLKTAGDEALVWVTDLTTGQPTTGIPVTLYNADRVAVAEGLSDADGLVRLSNLPPQPDSWTPWFAVAQTAERFGLTASTWTEGVEPYQFGIDMDYERRSAQPTVYVYTDRPLYRPGQTVHLKGVLRLDDDLAYSLPGGGEVRVIVESYTATVLDQNLPLSPYGTFAADLTLDAEATLGDYNIRVDYRGQTYVGSGGFGVAAYRKPTFQVAVSAEPAQLVRGDTATIAVEATFYSGGAVADAEVSWRATAVDYFFRPSGPLATYSFYNWQEYTPPWYGWDRYGWWGETIAEGSARTDGQGRATIALPTGTAEAAGSRAVTVEATVTDIGGNVVSGRATATVHAAALYIGVRSAEAIGVAEQPIPFDLIAVDLEARPVAGQALTARLVRQEWMSVQEESVEGGVVWRSELRETAVFTQTGLLTTADGTATVTFTPEQGGLYRVEVSTTDAQGNRAAASTFVWVAGRDFVPWRQTNDNAFQLVADAADYSPGDTARLLIASPFQGVAQALVTVERGRLRSADVLTLTSNSTVYELPITADMAPNVYVSVLVVKGIDETNPRPAFKIGMTQLNVTREQQTLTVALTPDRSVLGPGETVNWSVQVTDAAGRPAQAELSLALADLAALALAPRREAPILDFFYAPRYLNVRTALSLTFLMDQYEPEVADEFKGGGGGEGALGVGQIRQEFPDTAFWQAQLTTDADGRATFSVTLPDNLTTWRLKASAVTAETLVGEATADIVVTKPLLIQPYTPRFFVVGDEAQVGALVHNNTGAAVTATVSLQIEGAQLRSPAAQTAEIAAGRQAAVVWNITVADGERVDAVFSVNAGANNDASRPTLGTLPGQGIPVYRYEVPATAGTSGQLLTGGAVIEAIRLPAAAEGVTPQTTLTVNIAPSLSSAMTDGLTYLQHFPYECTEQVVSKFLPNVLVVRALETAGVDAPELRAELDQQVAVALQRLYARENSAGGWGWWDGSPSDLVVSSWVVLGLVEAQEAGYTVDADALRRGAAYLVRTVRTETGLPERERLNRQVFVEYAVARAGGRPVTFAAALNRLFEARSGMDLYAQALLAQTLRLYDADDPRAATLLDDLRSRARLSATGAQWEEASADRYNWNTDLRTTAIVLDALLAEDPADPLAVNGVRWLMAHRAAGGHWAGTQETAWALRALTHFMAATGELQPAYRYEVALNGRLLASAEATQATVRESLTLTADARDLLVGELNRLAIGRTDGTGNLYYTAHLQATVPVEQVQARDQGIVVSRSYFRPNARGVPVTQAAQGEILLARLTVIAPESRHYLIVADPLPAGLEAIDTTLLTSQQTITPPQAPEEEDAWLRGWGWWWFDHIELRDEKVVLSADYLPAGVYEYVYPVRAAFPGHYQVIPPTAYEFYFPEVYGRGDGSLFTVLERGE